MDFINLPDQFKLPILKKLNWRDLNNLKLVCKNFYFTIVKNIEKLDRPKVKYIKIFYAGNKILGAEYNSMYFEFFEEEMIPHHIEFNDDREYEIFLKNKDFTEIKKLVFENVVSGEVISLRDDYLPWKDVFYNYSSKISLLNMKSESLKIKILSTEGFRIPYSGILLKKESLRKMGLFERDGPNLVMKKTTMGIITGNPVLKYENTLSDTNKPLFIQFVDQLSELGFFNFKNRCNMGEFRFFVSWKGGSVVLNEEFYGELYDKITFENNSVKDVDVRYFPLKFSMKCLKCNRKHRNVIGYDKGIQSLYIILH
uniref:F-box domain-containing protein n=1 Tax=Strongyloides venezuelensis TaxID=75913 RepID=A0A0K0FGQ9_STRVS